jgi:hypothetical protein
MKTPIRTFRLIPIIMSLALLLPAAVLGANDQQYQQPVFQGDPGGGFYGADGDRYAGGGQTPASDGSVVVLDVPLIGPFAPVAITVPMVIPGDARRDTARRSVRTARTAAEWGAR